VTAETTSASSGLLDAPSTVTRDRAPILWSALERARSVGALGDGPIAHHVGHAAAYAWCVADHGDDPGGAVLDLGSGAGLPGLVLAHLWPERKLVLMDSARRRAELLLAAVEACGLGDRVEVVCARAEEAAHDPRWRAAFGVVVGRSFGAPAVVAECSAGFLAPGGLLVVSDPPVAAPERWPADAMSELGLVVHRSMASPVHLQVLRSVTPCPARFPRRNGVPAKRPLWPSRAGRLPASR
jgi:16S rRNA (guanine527-N7)-methyltransferase